MIHALRPFADDVAARLAGRPLVVMLDVDGTLAPIVARPELAAVPPDTLRAVADLAARDGVHLALVSGRAAADAHRMVPIRAWVIGNHGFEVVSPEGDVFDTASDGSVKGTIDEAARRLRAALSDIEGALVEHKGWTLSIHFRQVAAAAEARVRDATEHATRALGLRATEGKKVIEIRPAVAVDKGSAVVALAERLRGFDPGGAVAYVGDDRTDEDAFRALRARSPRAVTVRVLHDDKSETSAEFAVRDPAEVRVFLEWLSARPH